MKYKFATNESKKFNKHGVDLTIYREDCPDASVCHVSVKKGHFQEFYNIQSTYIYYIITGNGTFILNDEPTEVIATDLVVIPPTTRIHYFGTMEMILTIAPAFDEESEKHVRFISESESPYSN